MNIGRIENVMKLTDNVQSDSSSQAWGVEDHFGSFVGVVFWEETVVFAWGTAAVDDTAEVAMVAIDLE